MNCDVQGKVTGAKKASNIFPFAGKLSNFTRMSKCLPQTAPYQYTGAVNQSANDLALDPFA